MSLGQEAHGVAHVYIQSHICRLHTCPVRIENIRKINFNYCIDIFLPLFPKQSSIIILYIAFYIALGIRGIIYMI